MTTDTQEINAFLEESVRTGTIDVSQWPSLLPRLCERLEQIAKTDFPPPLASELPILPAPTAPASQPPTTSQSTIPDTTTLPSSQPPPSSSPPPLTQTSTIPLPSPLTDPLPQGTIHPEDASLITSLSQTLTNQFPTAPPHTYQRLFELLLTPRAHYSALPKWLRAVSRVISVSSPSTTFPLPITEAEAMLTLNGASSSANPNAPTNGTTPGLIDMDDSLGGALLTPIPWLEGVDADAVEEEGVSQGELLRREQELNIVPANQGVESLNSEGPPKIEAEDVGPQPEGTIFPDPPRGVEEVGSMESVVQEGEGMEGVEETGEGKVEGEGEKKEMEVEVEQSEEKKVEKAEDEMDVDAPTEEAPKQPAEEDEMDEDKREEEVKAE